MSTGLKLSIEPIGGLANRMRVIDSAVVMAAQYGAFLDIVWLLDSGCNCSFFQLFEAPNTIKGISVKEFNQFHLFNRLLHRATPAIIKLSRGIYMGQSDVNSDNLLKLNNTSHLYISTCSSLLKYQYTQLIPQRAIVDKVDTVCSQFNDHTIGVHIRRTDNRKSILKSPTSAFISTMQMEQQKNPDVIFFLATDDPEEETWLNSQFPGKIILNKKRSLHRYEASAIQDALVDLYCLSRTKKIIGSYWSSFSEYAAFLGNSELSIAGASA